MSLSYKAHILVVDDDPALLEQAEMILDSSYNVSLALSGRQAISYLERGQDADLILLDIMMPEMDGYETMKEIRKIPGYQSTPVVFLTGLSDADSELQCLSSGAADYISKPYDPRILLARISCRLEDCFLLDEAKLQALPEKLTETEWKVARLMARSYSNEDICEELHYALDTVKKLVSHVLEKLQIKSRKDIKKYFK